jgi:hypothetical protein
MLLSSALAIPVSPAASSAATMSFVVDEYLLLVMVHSFTKLGFDKVRVPVSVVLHLPAGF